MSRVLGDMARRNERGSSGYRGGVAMVAEFLADRYELDIRLGSGGMGDVYRARDHLLERLVAVKVPTTTVTPASAERFKREARAAARLNHPNIVGIYDWGGGTAPFIVMEYVEGRSLRAELRERHKLSPVDVAYLGAQIADALAHAHDHGVVHRDVKPSNVLLTPGGRVKVTDFGIAQSNATDTLTEPGVVLGTVGYLSPEQVAGLPADARSDIYSLGIVLTELLTGERPTGGEPDVSTELERVIARARAVDPSARYQAATELRDALRAAVTEGDGAASAAEEGPETLTAIAVDTGATARATGHAVTAVLPVPPVADGVVMAPARAGRPARTHRRSGLAKRTSAKAAKTPKPVKPMKPPKPTRRARRAAAVAAAAAPGPPAPARTWKLRHWLVIIAAPAVLVTGGVVAYAKLTEHAPIVAVPDVVDRDVFPALGMLHDAGFEVDARWADSARPGGTVLSQQPTNGYKREQGSTVVLTVSRMDAIVPPVSTMDVEDARVALAKRGLSNLQITPDYRDDVDAGTVMRTNPAAFMKARKADKLEVVVAADPHVQVPNVVSADQAGATSQLQALGLHVAVQTVSNSRAPVGQVLKSSPGAGATVVRGDTITLTVSSGPRQVTVPSVVGWHRDDAVDELEDRGFKVTVVTAAAAAEQVDAVLAQNPAGGRAAEGSTVTITVGVRAKKG